MQEQAHAALRERLQCAEAQADRLASENAQLVASLQQAAAASPRKPLRPQDARAEKVGIETLLIEYERDNYLEKY